MPLIDDKDIQAHLPIDKFNVELVPDSLTDIKLDVERIIKGRLSNVFSPLTLAGWSTEDDTPEYIRAIGGRLAAALIYRTRLAQDWAEDPTYAINKYNEAMGMLESVATGLVTLPEVEEIVDTGGHLSAGHYTVREDPIFTMDSQF